MILCFSDVEILNFCTLVSLNFHIVIFYRFYNLQFCSLDILETCKFALPLF